MPDVHRGSLRVVVVGSYLDPARRSPDELLGAGWRDFGRTAAAAARAGAAMTIVQAGWLDAERVVEGVTCLFVREDGDPWLPLSGRRRIQRRPQRLVARVAALAPDVIHFEGLGFPRTLRALAGALPGTPILAQDHGTKCPHGWRRWLYRWGLAPLAGVAFTARAQAEPFVARGVLRPGLPVLEVVEVSSRFTPGDREKARTATGMDGDPCLFWAGTLDPNKDPHTVLDAVQRVVSGLPSVRLYMCYRNAPLLQSIEARIASDPTLKTRVRLLGPVSHADMETHFRAADFLVQASHREGSGVALIEALACGATPIVTDIPSFRRITGEGAFGSLTPVGNPTALADAIRRWSAKDRAMLRREARNHFERDLSFEAIGRQLFAAYQAVARSR